ncbi:MAG: ATP-binding protein [Chloroflexi bacterium]|nr:ATP-binding protein [Chloroflexota bacterium]
MADSGINGKNSMWLVRIADLIGEAKDLETFRIRISKEMPVIAGCRRAELVLWDGDFKNCAAGKNTACPLARRKSEFFINCTRPKPLKDGGRICLKISGNKKVYGVLLTEWDEGSDFIDNNPVQGLLASLVGTGLQRLYSLEEYRRKIQEVTSLYGVLSYEFAAALTTSSDLENVLDQTIEAVGTFLDAEQVSIMLLDGKRKELLLRSQWSRDREKFALPRLRLGEGIAGWAAKHGKPRMMKGKDDPLYVPTLPGLKEMKSLLAVPMKVQGRIIGVINVGSIHREREFTAEETRTLELIASRAALALENADLLEKTQDDAREQKRLNRQLLRKTSQLEEQAEIQKLLNSKLKDNNRVRQLLLEFSQKVSMPVLSFGKRLEMIPETASKIFNLEIAGVFKAPVDGDIELMYVKGAGRSKTRSWISPFLADLASRAGKHGETVQAGGSALAEASSRKLKNLLVSPLLPEKSLYLFMGGSKTVWDAAGHRLLGIFLGNSALSLENALALEREKLERHKVASIVEGLGEGVIVVDRDRSVVMINPAGEKITGWASADAVGKFCGELFMGSDPNGADRCISRCPLLSLLKFPGAKRKEISAEGRIRSRNGDEVLVSSIHAPLIADGVMQGGVIVFRDITEERKIQQEKLDFLAGISHDIRNPFASIKGYAMALLRYRHKLSEEEQDEALRIINSEIDRLNRMLDNLIELSKMEAESISLRIEDVELAPLVRRVFNLYRVSASKHTFSYEEDGDIFIHADPILFYRVMNNLVSNAVKYSPEGGEVFVGAKPYGKMIRIRVDDEGPGIPADETVKVFERYKRGEDEKVKQVSGKGLGLYITKMLLQKMKGSIVVENLKSGGARFTVTVPGIIKHTPKGDG